MTVSNVLPLEPKRDTKFKKGQSGNPNGRPKGAKNKSTVLNEILSDRDKDAIIAKVVERAKDGDIQAIKIVMDRIFPSLKAMEISAGNADDGVHINIGSMTTDNEGEDNG